MVIDKPLLSTRRDALEFFIKRPEGTYTIAEMTKEGYGPRQQLKHHLIRLFREGQLDEKRDGPNVAYSLSDNLRKQLKRMQNDDKRKQITVTSEKKEEIVPVATPEPVKAELVKEKSRIRKGANGVTRNAIFELMQSAPDNEVSVYILAELFDLSPSVAGLHLRNLIRENKVKCSRKTKHGHLYLPIPSERAKTPRNIKQEILEHFLTNWEEYYSAKDIAEALSISRRDAQANIKILCEEQKIRIGSNGRLNEPDSVKYKIVSASGMPVVTTKTEGEALTEAQTEEATVKAPSQIAKKQLALPSVALPEPDAEPVLTKPLTTHIMFLRSIVQRLKSGQTLNEFDIQVLDDHVNSL